MDDMPLEGWIWEFIRRSQVYSIKLGQLGYVRDSLKQNNKADLLRQEYPGNINLFDEKNIENYYKNALTLINGDYNKYLYFKK